MAIRSTPRQEESVQNVADAQEGGEEIDQDIVESSREGHKDAPEDHERGACDGGKSSDEFISIEEDDEYGTSSEELKPGLGINRQVAPDEYSEIDGEENTISDHPAATEMWKDHDDNAEADDHESGSGESPADMCNEFDAIEVEDEGNNFELALQGNTGMLGTAGGGGSTQSRMRRRRASTARLPPPPPSAAAAEKNGSTVDRSSRKRRETVSGSSRPRWQ